jgi:clan AA aspartic protease
MNPCFRFVPRKLHSALRRGDPVASSSPYFNITRRHDLSQRAAVPYMIEGYEHDHLPARYNHCMGLVFTQIGISNVQSPQDKVLMECLVDSGASFSVIPREVLEQLGIQPYRSDKFSLANGEFIERQRGVAHFSFDDHECTSDVLFGEEGDAVLLGMLTLETMGLVLDPFRRELKTMPFILAGWKPGHSKE